MYVLGEEPVGGNFCRSIYDKRLSKTEDYVSDQQQRKGSIYEAHKDHTANIEEEANFETVFYTFAVKEIVCRYIDNWKDEERKNYRDVDDTAGGTVN